MLQFLLERGNDVHECNTRSTNAINGAIDLKVTKVLLDFKADLNAPPGKGQEDVIHGAARSRWPGVLAALVKSGAAAEYINKADTKGSYPIHNCSNFRALTIMLEA